MLDVRFAAMKISKFGEQRYGIPEGTEFPAAWRVGITGTPMASRIGFARKRDAEAAKAALERAGLDTRDKLISAEPDVFERIMIEALPW